jgi:RNase adaptor protein for sRNA GlmZ degradation
MEGSLIPNYHYVEIKPDYSDLEERVQYYIDHPEEAEAIIRHAHEYIAQFQDKRRERLISLLVLEKYFQQTGQL